MDLTTKLPLIVRQHKSLDVITLFHSSARPASTRVLNILKQASAEASEPATHTQAPDRSGQSKVQRTDFELDVTEDPPTGDQLRSILEYVGARRAGDLVKGVKGEAEAMRKLQEDGESFIRPVVSNLCLERPVERGLLMADLRLWIGITDVLVSHSNSRSGPTLHESC